MTVPTSSGSRRPAPAGASATPRAAKVVIALPAYGAARTLAKTVADIPPELSAELILVDDASPDDTVRLAHELGLRVFVHPRNRGYGGNQKTCYTVALREGADIVVLLHPDYQYDPKAIPLLLAPILAGDADMTFGSRFAGLGDPIGGGMPLYRFAGNRVTTILENVMLGSRFTDLHSGLRAYTRDCLLSLPFHRYRNDFTFDSELLVDAVTSGQRVVEVPIPTRYSTESSSISVGRSLRYVAGTLGYCARITAERGRRGRRSPVTATARRRSQPIAPGPVLARPCPLCGETRQVLLYPGNAEPMPAAGRFACTTDELGVHDDIVRCSRCGLVGAATPLGRQEILDSYERVVDEEYLVEEAARRELFSWVAARLEGYAVGGRRLVEIGSHVGLFLEAAAARGWAARGIEPSAWAVEVGRGRGLDLRRGVVEDIDDPPGSVDAVVMLDVLEHLVDPIAALERVRSLIDPSGVLVLSTVNRSSVHARIRGGSWPWFIRSHLWYFDPRTLHATLRRTGFRTVEWATVPRAFHVSYLAARASGSHPRLGALARAVSAIGDPRIPVGWLGDVALVVARPVSR